MLILLFSIERQYRCLLLAAAPAGDREAASQPEDRMFTRGQHEPGFIACSFHLFSQNPPWLLIVDLSRSIVASVARVIFGSAWRY